MGRYIRCIESHLRKLVAARGEMEHEDAAMWPAVVVTRTGKPASAEHVPRRVYRLIGAPGGSTLYWDQPLVAAAHNLRGLNIATEHAEAADLYIQGFLRRCVADNGLFQWGNHQYYDLQTHKVIGFHNGYHELRPITPAWELLWRCDPEATARYIRVMAPRHVYDLQTGGFNRHDDQTKNHAFIESGGILVESLAWLYAKQPDAELLQMALKIAEYSFGHRGPATGLVCNEPDAGRWDSKVCTTEVGVWANCLLRATAYTGCEAFSEMAEQAVTAYLRYGFDASTGLYFGQLEVETGEPVTAKEPGYWPGRYTDAWNTAQWPTHDYPMALAEACITLHQRSGGVIFVDAIARLADILWDTRPSKTGKWTYAENYGRCIHMLMRAGQHLDHPQWRDHAVALADESIGQLYEHDMFQGYPDDGIYEAVDGVGCLALAMIYVETGKQPETYGFAL